MIRGPWGQAAVVLLAAVFLTNIYRAATQSIAHDEGVIFEWLLSGSWSQVLEVEHGNHHVLSDLLCKLSITLLGPSEIAYRIPALLGGLLYFYAVLRISVVLFGEGYLLLLSVSVLSLNPFVLDYLCCARGYSPALGLFAYALYEVVRFVSAVDGNGRVRALQKAGVALGLSIGSNVIMIFPGTALILSLAGILAGNAMLAGPDTPPAQPVEKTPKNKRESRRKARPITSESGARRWQQALLHFALPALAIGGIISMLPNRLIELEAGYMGPPSLQSILEGLVRYSLLHSPSGFAGFLAWFPSETAIRVVTNLVVPALLAGMLVLGFRIIRALRIGGALDGVPFHDRFLLLLSGLLAINIGLIVLSRYAFQQPYPELRTVLYWIPLLGLACLGLLRRLGDGTRVERMFAVPLTAVLVLCVVQFSTQFNTRYFAEWQYCAAGKDMMQIVRSEHALKPGTRIRVGATWQLEPLINYYRVAWRLDWIDPVQRESPDNSFDYYLLAYDDVGLVDRLHLKTLLRDRLSGTVLARRGDL